MSGPAGNERVHNHKSFSAGGRLDPFVELGLYCRIAMGFQSSYLYGKSLCVSGKDLAAVAGLAV